MKRFATILACAVICAAMFAALAGCEQLNPRPPVDLASPIYADGRIYFCGQDGESPVIEANPAECKLLATNHLDGGFIWDFDKDTAVQFHVSNITNQLSFTEGDPLDATLKGPNGATNRGVGRPLFGRIFRVSLTHFF